MRAEILALLWLVAIGAMAWATLSASSDTAIPPDDTMTLAVDFVPEPSTVVEAAPPARPLASDTALGGRSLFRLAPTVEPQQAMAAAPVTAPPVLKGIIESDQEARAVFLVGADRIPRYEVLGPGETLDEIRIVSIDRDGVVVTLPAGGTTVFRLRGEGESP